MLKVHRILLAEDELKLSKVIKTELVKKGYDVDIAVNGLEAERLFNKNVYALILLDINLPLKNGLDLCKEFRIANKKIPIVMLTALGDIQDKVGAFNFGADDYIVKPFYFDELFARIKVFISRMDKLPDKSQLIQINDLSIDLDARIVRRGEVEIVLTSKEFALLYLLSINKGRVISKQEILEKVWDLKFDTGTNNIEVYISFLRNKIDKPFFDKLIFTKPGFGYFIKA